MDYLLEKPLLEIPLFHLFSLQPSYCDGHGENIHHVPIYNHIRSSLTTTIPSAVMLSAIVPERLSRYGLTLAFIN